MTEKELLDDIEFLIGSWFSAIEDEGCDPWENEECMSMASKYGYTKKETLCSVAHHIYNIDEDIVYSPNKYRETEGIKAQSTMHRIAKFDLSKQYNKYVDFRMIEIMEELKDRYNETNDPEDYLRLLYSNPCGFELTARLTTNYSCLKTIYSQRKNHRLPEWREFCAEIEKLPYAKELIID